MLKKYLHKNRLVYLLLVGGAIVTLLLVGYLNRSSNHTATEWSLFKIPEKSVELYFTNNGALPKKYTPGETSVISFTLAAYDTKKTRYAYEIIQQDEATGVTNTLTTGEIQLEGNRTLSKEVPVTYGGGGVRSKIVVRFPDEEQAIHYWVERQQ